MQAQRKLWIAMSGSGLMLAHQVAGKAARDTAFLTFYSASDLPKMVIGAAAVSVIFVLMFARVMALVGPRRLVPAGFLLSAAAHVIEYQFILTSGELWSVLIYLHIVALGAILLSGFWSQMAESFDPRTAKQVFGRITAAGTMGGILGGIAAERIAALLPARDVLLLLAGLHFLCAGIMMTIGGTAPQPAAAAAPVETISPRELFRRAPSLRTAAIMVVAGTASAAVIDYLFKAGASAGIGRGAPMLQFFAIFYTATQVLTFLAQTFIVRTSLAKLGIGRTISALPLGVGAGSLGALLLPVFPVFTVVRSLESILRGSVFRAGYELLYTPIPPAEKRAGKTIIDVGCDRAGDAIGAGLVQLLLWVGPLNIASESMGVVLGLAAIGLWAALRLDREYTGLLQRRLVDRAVELDLADVQDSTTLSVLRTMLPEQVQAPNPVRSPAPVGSRPSADQPMDTVRELRSGDARRVLAALGEIKRPGHLVASQLLRLLAWDEVSDAVRNTLAQDPRHLTGLLIDHLTNEAEVQFGVRRRIPRILARCDSQLALHGLIAGLCDTRFEVRFQCSRALDALLQRKPDLTPPASEIYAAVERELRVARPIWESHRLLDRREPSDPYLFLDEHLKERADQSLEHVFSLFAAVLPREPVKIAFRGLHTDDPLLRGLAMEYLEGVLPTSVWTLLWPVIEPNAVAIRHRPQAEVLSDLLQSHESMLMHLNRIERQP